MFNPCFIRGLIEPVFKEHAVALLHGDVTEQIIGAAFEVYGVLGYGFLESVYQKSMQVELIRRGLTCKLEEPIRVKYKEVDVGKFEADLLVNDCVIVELKVTKEYQKSDEAQLLNELKATGIQVGTLINFGRIEVQFQRFVY